MLTVHRSCSSSGASNSTEGLLMWSSVGTEEFVGKVAAWIIGKTSARILTALPVYVQIYPLPYSSCVPLYSYR